MLTMQRVFDCAATHLYAQDGEYAKDGSDNCFFRHNSSKLASTRCVIGLFIPDSKYFPAMELTLGYNIMKELYPDLKMKYGFITDLQIIHDTATKENVGKQLREFGIKYELDVSLVNLLFFGIKPEKKLSNQTVYDAVVVWMWAQNNQQAAEYGHCRYRARNSNFACTRCVAGLFITESDIDQMHEGTRVTENCPLAKYLNIFLISVLQLTHDGEIPQRKFSLRERGRTAGLELDMVEILFPVE